MRCLALRPEPGLTATLTKARAMGLEVTGLALSEIRTVAWDCPDPDGVDALLIGSANAITHGGADLARLAGKPVHAVGEATAAAVRAAGFTVANVGSAGLQGVLDAVPAPCRLLRIAGAEHVPLTAPRGITIATAIAYRSVPLPLDPARVLLERGGALALLHSAASARHFAVECDRLGLDRRGIALAALGARIAAAAGRGWAAVHTAALPDDAALLALAQDLCDKSASYTDPRPRQP